MTSFGQGYPRSIRHIGRAPSNPFAMHPTKQTRCPQAPSFKRIYVVACLEKAARSRLTMSVALNSAVSSATTGISVLDNAGVANGIGAGSYPDLAGNPNGKRPEGGSNGKSFGPILGNPNAFVAPQGLTFGSAGRNAMRNPSRLNFDAALLKRFQFKELMTFELRGETFNLFNHTQFRLYTDERGNTGSNVISCYGGPNNSAGFVDPSSHGVNCLLGNSFLHPVDAHRPRTIQFGLKVIF
jgi:hypothetical protein